MGENLMIKKFSVKNFKNFGKEVELDFSKVRDYEFNKNLIRNNLMNKLVIYGANNSGKSNLGAAIMDITCHLTDNKNNTNLIYSNYINGNTIDDFIEFKYEFVFGVKTLSYIYTKNSEMKLLTEELKENDNLIFKYNYKSNKVQNNIKEAETINIDKRNQDMSILKYIYNNTLYWEEDSALKLLMNFVNNMLWFRSLRSNEFMGIMANNESLHDFIINNNYLTKFESFLKKCGQNYNLVEINDLDKRVIGVKYKNTVARFDLVASTGTLSLWLFFYWMNKTDKISFIYLDEFDAFYHYELSAYILKYVNSKNNFQSILTTHNISLIDNELMRPDSYLILQDGKIESFADSTKKIIRQTHNLEKMMRGGEFEK